WLAVGAVLGPPPLALPPHRPPADPVMAAVAEPAWPGVCGGGEGRYVTEMMKNQEPRSKQISSTKFQRSKPRPPRSSFGHCLFSIIKICLVLGSWLLLIPPLRQVALAERGGG